MDAAAENTLVRQGGDAFPPNWGRKITDADLWQQAILAIGREHGIPLEGELKAGVEGSNAVFLTGDYVVKIYAMPWPVWFAREVECMRILETIPATKTPRLLAHGPAAGGDAQHPYLVMERLPGQPLSQRWAELPREARISLAAQLGPIVRALHTAPTETLQAFSKSPADWTRRMRVRAVGCADYLRLNSQMPPGLLAQLPAYLEANLPWLESEDAHCLLSGDIHGDHILIAECDGEWRVTGHIDFGDAEVGPVEYEWIALCLDAFHGDTEVIRAFFESYGWPLPLSEATRRRLKLYTLLHRFAAPNANAERAGVPTDAPTLDALLDSLWPI